MGIFFFKYDYLLTFENPHSPSQASQSISSGQKSRNEMGWNGSFGILSSAPVETLRGEYSYCYDVPVKE